MFLSYSRIDKFYADMLVAHLAKIPVPLWYDYGIVPVIGSRAQFSGR